MTEDEKMRFMIGGIMLAYEANKKHYVGAAVQVMHGIGIGNLLPLPPGYQPYHSARSAPPGDE